jgi:hypothetical protein
MTKMFHLKLFPTALQLPSVERVGIFSTCHLGEHDFLSQELQEFY